MHEPIYSSPDALDKSHYESITAPANSSCVSCSPISRTRRTRSATSPDPQSVGRPAQFRPGLDDGCDGSERPSRREAPTEAPEARAPVGGADGGGGGVGALEEQE